MTKLPVVALVGPPNAGKSTLINRIEGNHVALTSDVAGTTRDRQYVDTNWNGVDFSVVDTAGFMAGVHAELETKVEVQIDIAIKEADIIIFVVDGKAPIANIEQGIIRKVRQIKKPVILAINKTDSAKKIEQNIGDFSKLGIKEVYAISSLNGSNIGDLLDSVASKIKELGKVVEPEPRAHGIAVSIVGKPNVGKSSLLNRILGQERAVVSPVPGTTRNAIDTYATINGEDYTFIDTAGLKRKTYRQEEPDVFAGYQTFKSMRRSDVVLLLIDAVSEITKQDQMIAKSILDLEKGVIIVINKMDLYKGSEEALHDYVDKHFPQMWMSPVFFISAETGEGVEEMIKAIPEIHENRNKKLSDAEVDAYFQRKMKTSPPKRIMDQKIPRVFSLKQIGTNPPMFELYVNHPAAIAVHFRRTIQNGIVRELGFWGSPVILKLKGKDKK